jgi:hypothetical protein
MIISTVILLLLPVCAFVFFWRYALNRNWRYIRLFAFTASLSLGVIALILWVSTNIAEIWILEVGASFAILVGLMLLSLPITAPEILKQLNFKW